MSSPSTEADWTGNLINGKILEIILTEHLDYEVEYVFLPAGPATWEAMVAGDIDAAFEFWPTYSPERHEYIADFGETAPSSTSAKPVSWARAGGTCHAT